MLIRVPKFKVVVGSAQASRAACGLAVVGAAICGLLAYLVVVYARVSQSTARRVSVEGHEPGRVYEGNNTLSFNVTLGYAFARLRGSVDLRVEPAPGALLTYAIDL